MQRASAGMRISMNEHMKLSELSRYCPMIQEWLRARYGEREAARYHFTQCPNADKCDYCVVGSENPLAKKYEIVTDEGGFLVSRQK